MSVEKAFNKAKVGLILKGSVFLSTLAFSLKHRLSEEIPTAGTDGLTVLYNPDFFMKLSEEERIGLLAHEVWHVALSHMIRIGNRDHKLWNYAGDFVINLMLNESGFKLPETDFLDYKYKDWSTVRVYDDLIDKQKEIPKNYIPDILDLLDENKDKNQDNKSTPVSNEEQQSNLENKIKSMLVKATTHSKLHNDKPGSIPGEIQRMIDDLINPKLDWTELLHRFIDSNIKEDYTWSKPNRRFMPDYYLPSQYSESLSNITIAIDTSGSISEDDMTKMLSEINYIYQLYNPELLTILDCDRRIHNIYEINRDSNTDIPSLKFSGGGGTSFFPVIDYCKEHPTKLLIYFTDLHATQIQKEQDYPIMWLCYSNHKPSPIGETIYYDM